MTTPTHPPCTCHKCTVGRMSNSEARQILAGNMLLAVINADKAAARKRAAERKARDLYEGRDKLQLDPTW